MDLKQYLIQLGIETTAGVISDSIGRLLAKGSSSKGEVVSTLKSLHVENAEVTAENIIQFLARNGNIQIVGSTIHSDQSIEMRSSPGTSLVFGNNSKSSTPTTQINAGQGTHIKMTGGASIVQGEDGSIRFMA